MLPLFNMVVFKIAIISKELSICREASPSNLLSDLTSRKLNYDWLTLTSSQWSLSSCRTRAVWRGVGGTAIDLWEKGKIPKEVFCKNHIWEVNACSFMFMKGTEVYLTSFSVPHYSCFQSLHKLIHVWGRKGLQSPHDSIFKEQKERNQCWVCFTLLPSSPTNNPALG